jgi:acyl carrier protein
VADAAAIEADVRSFLGRNFPLADAARSLPANADFLDEGIIDSTGVLELVDFLEDRFAVRISDDELTPENLNSIDNIVRFVGTKSAA